MKPIIVSWGSLHAMAPCAPCAPRLGKRPSWCQQCAPMTRPAIFWPAPGHCRLDRRHERAGAVCRQRDAQVRTLPCERESNPSKRRRRRKRRSWAVGAPSAAGPGPRCCARRYTGGKGGRGGSIINGTYHTVSTAEENSKNARNQEHIASDHQVFINNFIT